jgi:hypothetical protein
MRKKAKKTKLKWHKFSNRQPKIGRKFFIGFIAMVSRKIEMSSRRTTGVRVIHVFLHPISRRAAKQFVYEVTTVFQDKSTITMASTGLSKYMTHWAYIE